ncbi:MAG: hypothetical protein AAF411_24680 [Myxococcota bacterium]
MSFWEDASGVTKGAIIFGIIAIIGAIAFTIMEPGGGDEPTTTERGLQAAPG